MSSRSDLDLAEPRGLEQLSEKHRTAHPLLAVVRHCCCCGTAAVVVALLSVLRCGTAAVVVAMLSVLRCDNAVVVMAMLSVLRCGNAVVVAMLSVLRSASRFSNLTREQQDQKRLGTLQFGVFKPH